MPETQKDIGTEPQGVVSRWKLELELADKQEQTWRKDAEHVIERYRGQDYRTDAYGTSGTQIRRNVFNILWSNVETLRPTLYNSTPEPVVRKRFKDEDPVGKAVSQLLERALKYSVDAYDFDRMIMMAVDDYLLPGRAVTRVKYEPTIDNDDEGNEELKYEEVTCEHVQWQDFRRGPGRTWGEVMWIAFRHKLTRDQLIDKFGKEKGEQVKLNLSAREDENQDKTEKDTDKSIFDRAEIWEIWDKEAKKVIFMSKEEKEPLSKEDDPLNLKDFYPIPRPLYAMESSNSLVPVPEYHLYETLARELDRATSRIMRILEGLRLRGVYDSTLAEMGRLFDAGDNEMIPAENAARFMESGGLKNAAWMLPVENYAKVLMELYEYRQALTAQIYEITGISDILRGGSDARETARAQEIKSQWGTLRLQRRQREIQRYARDILRLKAEIIAENFQVETLEQMTGMQYPTAELKQQAQQAMQQAQQQMQMVQQQGQEVPEPMQQQMEQAQRVLGMPSWEDLQQVMRNDLLRNFKIDIETDSTIAEEIARQSDDITDLMSSLVEFANGVGPATQSGLFPPKAVKSLLLAVVRRKKLGTEIEDEIEDADPQQNEGADPEQQKAQLELQKMQFEAEKAKRQHQWDMEKMRMEMEKERFEHQAEMRELQAKTQGKIAEQQAQAEGEVVSAAVGQ